jgi:hypothetical protein
VDETHCRCRHSANNRLGQILRHDRVTVLGTGEGGIVQYAYDCWPLVYLDNGLVLTCSLDQIRWAGQ